MSPAPEHQQRPRPRPQQGRLEQSKEASYLKQRSRARSDQSSMPPTTTPTTAQKTPSEKRRETIAPAGGYANALLSPPKVAGLDHAVAPHSRISSTKAQSEIWPSLQSSSLSYKASKQNKPTTTSREKEVQHYQERRPQTGKKQEEANERPQPRNTQRSIYPPSSSQSFQEKDSQHQRQKVQQQVQQRGLKKERPVAAAAPSNNKPASAVGTNSKAKAQKKKSKPSSNLLTLSDLIPLEGTKGGTRGARDGPGKNLRKKEQKEQQSSKKDGGGQSAGGPITDNPPSLSSFPPLSMSLSSPKINGKQMNGRKASSLERQEISHVKGSVNASGTNKSVPSTPSQSQHKEKKKKGKKASSINSLPLAKGDTGKEGRKALSLKRGKDGEADGRLGAAGGSKISNDLNATTFSTDKKGRRRLGPRKKRLTTLKKRVLQERLRKWKEHEASIASSPKSELDAGATGEDTVLAGNVNTNNAKGRGNEVNGNNDADDVRTVCLANFVQPDEVEDDDDCEEIVSDVSDMASKIGPVDSILVTRNDTNVNEEEVDESEGDVGLVFVTFTSRADAVAARQCWDGIVVGGNRVRALFSRPSDYVTESRKEQQEQTQPETASKSSSPNALSRAFEETGMVLDNILTEDDFIDEECLEESKEDIWSLCGQYGKVINVRIELGEVQKGRVYVSYESGPDTVSQATREIDGMVIGGQKVTARSLEDDARASANNVPTDTSSSVQTTGFSTYITLLENVLTEDDFEDDDCLEESKEDILAVCRQHGRVGDIRIEQNGDLKGKVYVYYLEKKQAAVLAVENLDGMIMGGQRISARLIGDVVLSNVLTEEDFMDKECLDESKSDILSLVSKYGDVTDIQLEPQGYFQGELHKGLVYVRYHEGKAVASTAVHALNGIVIGGQIVKAWSLHDESEGKESTYRAKECDPSCRGDRNTPDKVEPENEPSAETSGEASTAPMYSGDKIIPERFAACKRVPKIPNSVPSRSYASRIDSDDAVPLLNEMLGELMRFQLRSKDDANARARRRLVLGLREVARGLRAKKVKMVIMANNLDDYGVIDSKLEEIIDLAREWDVPVLFELNKRKLGKALGKTIKVSVVGVQNADGAHEQFKKLKKLASLPRKPVPVQVPVPTA